MLTIWLSVDVGLWMCVHCPSVWCVVEGDDRVVRTCATGGRPDDGCVARTGTSRIKLWYCECRGDACNAAPPSLTTGSVSLLLLLTTALLSVCLA